MENFNWISIIIAGLVPSVLGVIWHHPMVFGGIIDNTMGEEEVKMKKGHKPYVHLLSLALSFLIAFYLPYIVLHDVAEFATFKHGAMHASIAALHLAIPLVIVNYLYEQKPIMYIFLNVMYWLLSIAIMGGVISAMAKSDIF